SPRVFHRVRGSRGRVREDERVHPFRQYRQHHRPACGGRAERRQRGRASPRHDALGEDRRGGHADLPVRPTGGGPPVAGPHSRGVASLGHSYCGVPFPLSGPSATGCVFSPGDPLPTASVQKADSSTITAPPTTPRAGPPTSTSHPDSGAENATPVVIPVFIHPNASARRSLGATSPIRSVAAAKVGAIASPATNSTGRSSHGEGSSSTGGSSGISIAVPAAAAKARRLNRGGPAKAPATSPPTREPIDQDAASTLATPG